jgi:hypothetical protein
VGVYALLYGSSHALSQVVRLLSDNAKSRDVTGPQVYSDNICSPDTTAFKIASVEAGIVAPVTGVTSVCVSPNGSAVVACESVCRAGQNHGDERADCRVP